MLGTPDELRIDFELLQSRLTSPAARAAMEEVLLGDAVSYLATLALDEAALAQFVGDGPTNTDDRPYISFTDRKRGGTAAGLPALASLMPHMCESVLPHLVETAAPATGAGLDRRFEARKHTYLGTVAYLKGDWERARRELTEALRVDPGEENAARILKRLRPPLRQGG